MFKKSFLVFFGSILVAGAIWATLTYLPRLAGFIRGISPVIKPPPADITKPSSNTTGLPLNLPPGFSIEIFAKDLEGARVMAVDSEGNMWVSQTSEGKISMLEVKAGKVVNQKAALKDLRKPHGLAFDPEDPSILYIAEEHRISKVDLSSPTPSSSPPRAGEENKRRPGEEEGVKIADLPCCSGHFTRTIKFGPDSRLYVSIGSSCNVCEESDDRRAKIFSMNKDGSDFREYASGLRNAVFFTWHPRTGEMWATEMGRDLLGDDLPPDEINIVAMGPESSSGRAAEPLDFGWPECYGKNVLDENFHRGNHQHFRAHCEEPVEYPSQVDLPAHSAPLGLAFVPPAADWPQEYWDDLLVAFHGSWNRSEPTGYKVVRLKLDDNGNYEGMEDFITGWLTPEGALGRPVDILVQPSGGAMYLSDDKAGVIYKITYQNFRP